MCPSRCLDVYKTEICVLTPPCTLPPSFASQWSHADVAAECENWLGPKGFNGVQISPPNEHIVGDQWWTRYQPVTYNITSRSGDEDSFKDMISRCEAVGVSVIADSVVNHMAAGGGGKGVGGTSYTNRAFPDYEQVSEEWRGAKKERPSRDTDFQRDICGRSRCCQLLRRF